MTAAADIPQGGASAPLVFGVGATKSGTSWLYRYLAGHPQCHLRSLKELHFFDAHEMDGVKFQLRQLRKRRDGHRDQRNQLSEGDPARRARTRQIQDISAYLQVMKSGDTAAYLAYLNDGAGPGQCVADVTPAYALLPEARLRAMAALAPVTRFVYLMRDPVARLWSHVRMIAQRTAKGAEALAGRAGEVLGEVLSGGARDVTSRGDYAGALARLDAAVAPDRLFIAFYEELFTDATLDRLCAFLGIDRVEGNFGRRVHAGVRLEMTEAQRGAAARLLAPQYEFVEARMGRLPDAWDANRKGV